MSNNKRLPRAYVRAGYAQPHKEEDYYGHLHSGLSRALEVARSEEGNGISHFSVVYDTPERLGRALKWMSEEGRKIAKGADFSLYTDKNSNGKPRMWVQIILNR